MKKTALSALAHAQSDSWRLFPIMEPGHQLKPTLALTGGTMDPKNGPSDSIWGAEFSFNCGLIQSPGNRIRSYLQVNRYDKNNLKATAFELSPRYTVPMAGGFAIGAGPSLTAVRVNNGTVSKTVYGAGVAAGLDWRSGSFYAGADVRWHDTNAKDGVQYDGTAVGLKVGVNF
jgi:hypothetical protein